MTTTIIWAVYFGAKAITAVFISSTKKNSDPDNPHNAILRKSMSCWANEEAKAAQCERERQRQELLEKETRRLEETEALTQKLQELQNQKVEIPEELTKPSDINFILLDTPKVDDYVNTIEITLVPEVSQTIKMIPNPHCHIMSHDDSLFCIHCGQKISKPQVDSQPPVAPTPSQIYCPYCHQQNPAGSTFCTNCGKSMIKPAHASALKANIPQVRYANESMKKWELNPYENVLHSRHEISLLQRDGGKFAYYMEVTNQRLLFTREGNGAKRWAWLPE